MWKESGDTWEAELTGLGADLDAGRDGVQGGDKRASSFWHEIQEGGGATIRDGDWGRSSFRVMGQELSFRHAEFGACGVSQGSGNLQVPSPK